MIKLGIVGLGKMGLSHLSMLAAHPDVDLAAICDSSNYVLGVLEKYTGMTPYTDYDEMLDKAGLDAVFVATPSSTHAKMVRAALERDLHVFCEKPFTLSTRDADGLTALAEERGLVTQVGYHNRFVGAFGEVKRLVDAGAIGEVTHGLAEAYGPVVLKAKGSTWRTQASEGGGCLYDYAAHAINLVNWYMGMPTGVGGSILNKVFSRDTDDEVSSTLFFPGGRSAQLSVNWSDESQRKMTTSVSLWGTDGHIYADRQECRVYLRDTAKLPQGYKVGWNVRYTTELTNQVWFYLRGEEYSAQIDAFVQSAKAKRTGGENDFRSAAMTDTVIEMILADSRRGASTTTDAPGLVAESTPLTRLTSRPRLRWLRQLA